MNFRSKKPTKNPSKTRPEPLQNRCWKCVVFQHRFFRVLASILEPLGPPTWSQVGLKTMKFRVWNPPPTILKLNILLKLCLGGFLAPFWRLQGYILEPPWLDFNAILVYFGKVASKYVLQDMSPKIYIAKDAKTAKNATKDWHVS